MKSMWKWSTVVLASVFAGCIGEPSCEDLATCLRAGAVAPPVNDSENNAPDAGSVVATEDCTNDEDDDGDGKTDCGDSDCKANPTCEVQLPLNFDGFAVISILSEDEAAPTCADGSEAVILYQNPNEQLCDACTCEALDVSCSLPYLGLDIQSAACGNLEFDLALGVDECISIDLPDVGIFDPLQSAATYGQGHITGGECSVKGGVPITTSAMKTKVAACALKEPSEVVAGNEEYVCMHADGHLPSCPDGWSAVSTTAFTGYIDERQGCTTCGCNSGCSGGGYEVFAQSGCSGDSVLIGADGACVAIPPTGDFSILGKAPTGTCAISGGEPIGKVFPTGEKTFCCRP